LERTLGSGDEAPALSAVMRSMIRRDLAAHRHRSDLSRGLGVSDEEMLVLLHLTEHGASTQGRLASFIGLSRSGMGAMLQRLESAALVVRRPDRADKRVRLVDLSPGLRERIVRAYADLSAGVDELLSAHAPAEQRALEQLLQDVADLSERLVRQPARDGGGRAHEAAASAWRLWG
jgi:DNA-binding MarR family transcriptional regulator